MQPSRKFIENLISSKILLLTKNNMSTNKSSAKGNMAEFVVQPDILEAKYANYFGV